MSLPAQSPGSGSRPAPAVEPHHGAQGSNQDVLSSSSNEHREAVVIGSSMAAGGVIPNAAGGELRSPLPPRPIQTQTQERSTSLDPAQYIQFQTIGASTSIPSQSTSDEQADGQSTVTAHRRIQTARRSRPFIRLSNPTPSNRHLDTTALDQFPPNSSRITRRSRGVAYAGFRYRSRTIIATHADLLAEIGRVVIDLTETTSDEESSQEDDTANYRENFC